MASTSSTLQSGFNEMQTHLITQLNGLLSAMSRRQDVLNAPQIFAISSNAMLLAGYIKRILTEPEFDIQNERLEPHLSANLLKRIIVKLREQGVVLIETPIDQNTELNLNALNSNPEIQTILDNLFRLLKNIAENELNGINAANLSTCIASCLFPDPIPPGASPSLEHGAILILQSTKISALIEAMPASVVTPPLHLIEIPRKRSSSTASIFKALGGPSLNDIMNFFTGADEIVISENHREVPRGFIRRHLSKMVMSPSVAVFAGVLTAAFLIAFPPAGITLGLLMGAVALATVAGFGIGYGIGAIIDHVRDKECRRERYVKSGAISVNASPRGSSFMTVDSDFEVDADADSDLEEENGIDLSNINNG